MAITVPAHICALHGKDRLKATHAWRAQVHELRSLMGFLAFVAVFAIILIVFTDKDVQASALFTTFKFTIGIVSGFLLGGSVVFGLMHFHKMNYHRDRINELSGE